MGVLLSALRQFARTPGTNAVAALSVAIGVGCAAAAFSVADPVFLRPLPYAEPDALFSLKLVPDSNGRPGRLNLADFAALKTLPDVRVAAFQPRPGGRLRGHHQDLRSMGVTAGFFDVLGVALAQGRAFTDSEHRSESLVCLLAHTVAETQFGAASSAIGKSFTIEAFQQRVYTVVGVLPPGFLFPDTREAPAMIVPMSETGPGVGNIIGDVQIVARLSQGADRARLASHLRTIAASSEAQYPKLDRDRQTAVSSLSDALFGGVTQSTLVIFVAVLSIALLGCVNLYHILAIQLRRRSKDLGIVTALGATRGRLVAELVVERVLIAAAGAATAILIAHLLRTYLIGELPAALAVLAASAEPINHRVVGFVVAASFACVAVTAVHPIRAALQGTQRQDWLKDRSASRTRPARRADGLLIVSQSMATFLVLMISVTVVRGLVAIGSQPLGFDYGDLRSVQPVPAPEYFSDRASSRSGLTRAAYTQLKARYGKGVAANIGYPAGSMAGAVAAAGGPENLEVPSYRVTGDFFNIAGLELIAGSTFDEWESLVHSEKAVIDEVAAQRLWPGANPLGRVVEDAEESRRYEVVGLVRAVGRELIETEPREGAVFLPFEDRWARLPMFSYRSGGVSIPDVTVILESTMAGSFVSDEPLRPFRVQFARHEFLTTLIGAIAVFDLLIVIVGIWSLISNQLHAERRDMSVRMALGARPGTVVKMILTWRVLVPVCAGIALGAAAYWSFARNVVELTFKTPPFDATSLSVAMLVVLAAALVPAVLPSLRLARDNNLLLELR